MRHQVNLVITSGNRLALISFHALMTKVVTNGIWMGNWNRKTRNFQVPGTREQDIRITSQKGTCNIMRSYRLVNSDLTFEFFPVR